MGQIKVVPLQNVFGLNVLKIWDKTFLKNSNANVTQKKHVGVFETNTQTQWCERFWDTQNSNTYYDFKKMWPHYT